MNSDAFWLNQRHIFVVQPITHELATKVVAALLYCQREQPGEEITMVIRSPGGVVYAAMAIHDTMCSIESPSPVSTVGSGTIGGIATLLLAAGTQGKRFVTPTCRVWLPRLVEPNKTSQGREEELLKIADKIDGYLIQHTHITKTDLDILKETPISAEEMIRWGIADYIKESELD